ncbi:MAG: LPS export ABC transporter periplasmic protein LptC [Caulobacterales bacterium]|jgi:lipopolysaccharide export system protein LptC
MRRHSLFVHLLRWLLPAAMLGMIALLAGLVALHAVRTQAARPRESPGQIRMINPHFVGRDQRGQAFTLSAQQATRDDSDPHEVLLTGPIISVAADSAQPSTLIADSGVYQEDTGILRLLGHVHADDAKASSATSAAAIIDTRTGKVTGPASIATQTSMGETEGRSYMMDTRGQRVILRGGVHARLKAH